MLPLLYSICATTYNCADTLNESVGSITRRADTRAMEFVVCDSKSNDGTPEVIQRYSDFFKTLKIISKRCTRGEGRWIAFKNSTGRYIIQVDLDTVYNDAWGEFVKWHRRYLPDFVVQTMGSGIYPRGIIERVGGWKNLNYSEDLDMWIKLARIGKLRWSNLVTGYNYASLQSPEQIRKKIPNPINRWIRKVIHLRDLMALHRISWTEGLLDNNFKPNYIFLYSIAKLLAAGTTGVTDVRKYDRQEIIDKNAIELPIDGIRRKGSWKDFGVRTTQQKGCLICGSLINPHDFYCSSCLNMLKKEHLIN
jgi:hypothetical protein